jgi:nucleoside-diphosphate-sugar epimerase
MSKGRILVTGATGMVGSLVCRKALAAGYTVRALVRRTADRALLAGLAPEFVEGDLSAPESFPAAVADAQYVVHAAAKVGDWGHADDYRAINVFALEQLASAVEREGKLRRWIQISSLGVYQARDHFGTDETEAPDIEGLDGYTRTKAEAEVLLKQHVAQYKLPAVILRPGFIYGAGDRHVVPRLIDRLRAGKMKLLGSGQKVLNNTYVGNLVDAVLLALDNDMAAGQTFNIRDERLVTREEFIGTIADYLNLPRPGKVPLAIARPLTSVVEGFAKLIKAPQAPMLTKARLKFLTLNLDFSIDKAKRVLGYEPAVDFRDGMREALDWATQKANDECRMSNVEGMTNAPMTKP